MDSFKLKVFAIAAMTLDHVVSLFWVSVLFLLFPNVNETVIFWSSNIMHWIGRMAFPLFAFMTAEGCRHTHSMKKYLVRLGIFVVVSQPFYWLAFHGGMMFEGWASIGSAFLSLLHPDNVFVTLFLGALAVYAFQQREELAKKLNKVPKWCSWLLPLAVTGAACLIAGPLLHSDYEYCGVLAIVLVYLSPNKYMKAAALILFAFAQYFVVDMLLGSAADSWFNVCASSSAALPVLIYNGKRGRSLKWLFYWYYPVHLLIVTVIRVLVVGE